MFLNHTILELLQAIAYMAVFVCILTGIVLILLSYRGMRLDNHPVCSKCKYDLQGSERPFTRCPECGTYLNKKRATKVGNRAKSPLLFSIGLILLLPASTFMALDLYSHLTGERFNAITPSKMLHYKLTRTDHDHETHLIVLDELTKRAAKSELSISNHLSLIDELLQLPRHELAAREPIFSAAFFEAHNQQILSTNHYEKLSYLMLPNLQLDVASTIYEGSNLPINLVAQGKLLGLNDPQSPLQLQYTIKYAFDDHDTFVRYRKKRIAKNTFDLNESLHIAARNMWRYDLKPDQDHTFNIIIDAEVFDTATGRRLYNWKQNISKKFYLKSRRVKQDFDRGQYLTVRRALTSPFRDYTSPLAIKFGEDMIYTSFNCEQLEIPMYHKLVAQIDKNSPQDIAFIKGTGPWELTIGIPNYDLPHPDSISLYLTPLFDDAEQDQDMHTIFTGYIEFQVSLEAIHDHPEDTEHHITDEFTDNEDHPIDQNELDEYEALSND
ncbi:hypothetical protein JD969_07180 [Planctomycetota bacterium]|nr:hypothetical protein JD969_07180 [Planctomycetota bacterium]